MKVCLISDGRRKQSLATYIRPPPFGGTRSPKNCYQICWSFVHWTKGSKAFSQFQNEYIYVATVNFWQNLYKFRACITTLLGFSSLLSHPGHKIVQNHRPSLIIIIIFKARKAHLLAKPKKVYPLISVYCLIITLHLKEFSE